jgi:putative transposase
MVYHVFNRGNGRMRIFREPGDYEAFVDLLVLGKERASIELFGFCLMPDHWHLILRPRRAGDLAAYLSWVTNTHVKRYRGHYSRTSGHLYQGRYKSFPVQEDSYFLSLMRYVEANPLRPKLVFRAQDWKWSSRGCQATAAAELLSPWPLRRPADWKKLVNRPLPETERERIKSSLERGRPLGDERWTAQTARRLGLQFTLNPRGRPPTRSTATGKAGK